MSGGGFASRARVNRRALTATGVAAPPALPYLCSTGVASRTLAGMQAPETWYAKSGDLHIAYQVLGDGPVDLVFVAEFWNSMEAQWESRTSNASSVAWRRSAG